MKLTKTHKQSLYNIIVNKLTDPSKEIFKEIKDKMQEWVFSKADPAFELFYKAYGTPLTEYLIADVQFNGRTHAHSITLYIPTYGFLTSISYLGFETRYIMSKNFNSVIDKYPELDWLIPKTKEALELLKQFQEDLCNLEHTINSCTTDTQLSEMYPDFVQFFNKAGITKKVVKQLPSVLGLPENLSKYGLKLTTTESIEENTRK